MILKNIFNLQLFAEESTQAAVESTSTNVDSGETTTTSDAGMTTQETEVSTKPTFEEMIKGEYKKDFDSRVQKIINERFKDHKPLSDYKKNSEHLMSYLSERFGKGVDDFEGILDAIRFDDSYIEAQALKEGKTPEEYREKLKAQVERDNLTRENNDLKKQIQEREKAEADERSRILFEEDVRKVKEAYGDFDISAEMKNADFVDLLRRGVPMKAAYEVVNRDKIIANAMHYTADKVKEQVTNNIKARGSRPAENGLTSQAASATKTDVSNLTREGLNDIMKRVARGEKITF